MVSIVESSILNKQQKILSSFKSFKITNSPEFATLVNFSQTNLPIHRWFKYREGFSPLLVKHFIDSSDKWILDPFCGSGTTLVESMNKNKNSIGIDLNPLSTFVARVKTKKFSSANVEKIKLSIKNLLEETLPSDVIIPNLKIIDKVFHPGILHLLLQLKGRIKEHDENTRDFLLFGWLSILERVSNTRKEGNGLKYRSTVRTKTGYIHIKDEEWQNEYFGKDKIRFVKDRLSEQYARMIADIEEVNYSSKLASVEVITSDNSDIKKNITNKAITKVIFSPPYANSFDYFEIFKAELWMGDFIKTYDQLRELRKKSIGSLWSERGTSQSNIPELEELFQLLDTSDLWDNKIQKMLHSYFTKMRTVTKNIHECLSEGGKCIIVVGNSAYGNVIIPTDLILSQIAKEIGFGDIKVLVARHLTTSSQQKKNLEPLKQFLRESILIFEK